MPWAPLLPSAQKTRQQTLVWRWTTSSGTWWWMDAGNVRCVNEHFQHIFHPYDDMATGAVSYCKGVAARAHAPPQSPVQLMNTARQGEQVITLIQKHLAHSPTDSIAILVRARSHL